MATPAFFSANKLESHSGKIRPPKLTLRQSEPANLRALRGHGQIKVEGELQLFTSMRRSIRWRCCFPRASTSDVGEAAPARAEIGRDQGGGRPEADPGGTALILQRARMMSHYSKAVEEAVTGMKLTDAPGSSPGRPRARLPAVAARRQAPQDEDCLLLPSPSRHPTARPSRRASHPRPLALRRPAPARSRRSAVRISDWPCAARSRDRHRDAAPD